MLTLNIMHNLLRSTHLEGVIIYFLNVLGNLRVSLQIFFFVLQKFGTNTPPLLFQIHAEGGFCYYTF